MTSFVTTMLLTAAITAVILLATYFSGTTRRGV